MVKPFKRQHELSSFSKCTEVDSHFSSEFFFLVILGFFSNLCILQTFFFFLMFFQISSKENEIDFACLTQACK